MLVGPAVGGAARDFNGLLYPSTEAPVRVPEIVSDTLHLELVSQPRLQLSRFFLGKPFILLPTGLDRSLEFFIIQLLEF